MHSVVNSIPYEKKLLMDSTELPLWRLVT